MRTATPLVTCGRMTLWGPSATSLSISTPRFMGPGWRISRSFGARASRSRVTPKTRLYSRRDGRKPACIRSSWSRRTLRASAHWMASSIRGRIVTPSSCTLRGRSVAGPQTPTWAPSLVSPQMLLRATRLCRMSPQIATLRPSIRLNRSRRVRMSSRPCVGCSCLPSPALMTLLRIRWPRNCAAPDAPWRITTMSIRIASRLRAVSTRVSPLETEDPADATFTVSALSRFSANSNEIRVRVEASKNRLTMVLPRSAGTFLIGRSLTSLNGSAVSRMRRIWSALSGSRPTRSLPSASPLTSAPHQLDGVAAVQLGHEHVHPVAGAGAHGGADDIGLDRQLAAATVDQHAEEDAARPAEVGALVECRAHGAAGVQHVVHDDDRTAVEIGEPRFADHGAGADGLEVVAIQGDIQLAAGDLGALGLIDLALETIGQLDSAPLDPHQDQRVGAAGSLDDFGGHAHQRPAERAVVEEEGPGGHRGGKLVVGLRQCNSRETECRRALRHTR